MIDRITILEIKAERLPVCVREAVLRDLAMAEAARDRVANDSEHLAELTTALRCVNRELWEIEDELRLCEARASFGARFVELSRKVYTLNDRRAALKRAIDDLLDCEKHDYKSHALPQI